MLTPDQIEQFISLVDEEARIDITDSAVVATQDQIQDFIAQHGAADEVSNGLHVWHRVQSAKGQQHRTLCVYDFGAARAACSV